MPTYLMGDGKCGVKPVVLDDSAAPLWRADGADVRHAQRVTGVVATEVLDKENTGHLNQKLITNKEWTSCSISRYEVQDNP